MNDTSQRPILVLGAGIAGITTALEAAEAGAEVILVEREQAVGGRVLRIHNYFPKLCPPTCGNEINVRRLEKNPRIRVLTGAQVTGAERQSDGWSVTVTQSPQYVNDNCTLCGECEKVCTTKVPDPTNLGMVEVPAMRLANADAFPRRYMLDPTVSPDQVKECADACKYDAIDLDAKATEETFEVKSMVVATGWTPYSLDKLEDLGGGFENVLANVALERLAAPSGPTGGKILRPSDGEAPKRVAFVQCAGSRDIKHLPYCSGVCCLASLKQALYVREQYPDAEVSMYYIDRRAPGRNEQMLTKAEEAGVKLVKGKVGKVTEGENGVLILRFEDQDNAQMVEAEADLVVLATGMVPNGVDFDTQITMDDDGFVVDDHEAKVFVAGVARRPEDVAATVRDATGAAAKSMVGGRIS